MPVNEKKIWEINNDIIRIFLNQWNYENKAHITNLSQYMNIMNKIKFLQNSHPGLYNFAIETAPLKIIKWILNFQATIGY